MMRQLSSPVNRSRCGARLFAGAESVIVRVLCLCVLLACSAISVGAGEKEQTRKLIEWSADEPDTNFIRQHWRSMEQQSFDGFVFRLATPTGEQMMWQMWGGREYQPEEFEHCLGNLQAAEFKQLQDRFIRVNVTPGRVDWFDDVAWAGILENFRIAARIAKQSGCVGLLFDTEQYVFRLFDSEEVLQAYPAELAALKRKVDQRGRQWIRAVNEEFPGLKILMTFGYRAAQAGEELNFRVGNYELLAPFLDGMLAACDEQTVIIDGWEYAYGYKMAEEFETARKTVKKKALKWTAHARTYHKQFQIAFPVWTDYALKDSPWNETDFSRNFHTPAEFGQRLQLAAKYSDEYVWLYSAKPKWWTGENLPEEYRIALQNLYPLTVPNE